MSPLSPILTNPTPILTMKTQNQINLMNNNINNNTILRTNTKLSDKLSDKCLNDLQSRREARKIRNRESAQTSRVKKKEYVIGLEQRIDGLLKENSDLKTENERLKTKLIDLENKNKCLAKRSYTSLEAQCKCRSVLTTKSNKKAALSLLAVVFMLGLNLAPFSGVLIANDESISSIASNQRRDSVTKHGTSRTLLWNPKENSVDMDVIGLNSSGFKNDSNSNIDCKTYINQTESLRLETDLRDWLSKVKLEKEEVFKYKRQLKAKTNKQLKDRFNKPIPLTRLKAWIQKRTETDFNEFNEYSIETYKTGLKIPQINYEDLLSAIHRRDDTFYLLSYSSKDHLIIPPMSRNSSEVRPRFSLLIPLISTLNESLIRGTNVTYSQMSVMQIDCQVINTKMVLFNTSPKGRSDITSDLSNVRNTTLRTKTPNKTSIIKKNFKRS